MDAYGDVWVHQLPKVTPVDRVEYIERACEGKRVIHVGFWGTHGSREKHMGEDRWLHARLAARAREIVGLDHNDEGVEEARGKGYESYSVDARSVEAVAALDLKPADLVVAGEIIEHLERPGEFLDAMHPLVGDSGRLLITTPNAYRLTNTLVALTGKENMNPDHIAIYSWFTLKNLMDRHGWDLDETVTYNVPRRNTRAARAGIAVQRIVSKRFPFLANGLIMVGKPRASWQAPTA